MSQLLSALSAGSLVKLNENGKATKFIVLGYNHYSKSEVVLLRKDTFAPRQWTGSYDSSYNNCYYGSDVDMFCNTQYPQMLDPIIRACLVNVPILVAEGASYGGTLVTTLHTLYRKGFLLSSMEAMGTAGYVSEGSAFTYLSGSASNRIAYSDGTATAVGWWLRSPGSDAGSAYFVNTSGALYSYAVYFANSYCPRPALALSSLISVSSSTDSDGCYTVESAPAAEQYIKTGGVWTKMV
jgi:hypothetical protein